MIKCKLKFRNQNITLIVLTLAERYVFAGILDLIITSTSSSPITRVSVFLRSECRRWPNVGPTFKSFCKCGEMRQRFANRNMTFQSCLNLHGLINISNF